ncbi:hypothetical protein L226DRAFT_329311 [Lentinus tigrinus ALCF2SS1-7]|uniref:Uncharacterized protein n=1 Tax=Lentinus tigrinus ALCF2SS1-6 TaxID=1328759 RepID=A0A5C2SFI6_9APHY|nr:hypothetical protein L227DRAFT_429019 [Lentinus tigrinus ALCF2SS1-6]RPD77688.1 hypothetical protein L226DRAFT_329311 [Lentinus tigrinus ALCF2SS1-7]
MCSRPHTQQSIVSCAPGRMRVPSDRYVYAYSYAGHSQATESDQVKWTDSCCQCPMARLSQSNLPRICTGVSPLATTARSPGRGPAPSVMASYDVTASVRQPCGVLSLRSREGFEKCGVEVKTRPPFPPVPLLRTSHGGAIQSYIELLRPGADTRRGMERTLLLIIDSYRSGLCLRSAFSTTSVPQCSLYSRRCFRSRLGSCSSRLRRRRRDASSDEKWAASGRPEGSSRRSTRTVPGRGSQILLGKRETETESKSVHAHASGMGRARMGRLDSVTTVHRRSLALACGRAFFGPWGERLGLGWSSNVRTLARSVPIVHCASCIERLLDPLPAPSPSWLGL